jgi:hypothetical protein
MPRLRLPALGILLLLPGAAAHADQPAARLAPSLQRDARLPPEPLPQGKSATIAASACYAGPMSCKLRLPLRPGQPCHCHGRSGLYWGKAM